MYELKFSNPVFHQGKNVTVRRGIKWNLESVAYIKNIGTVIFTNNYVIRAKDIASYMVENEHDPKCQTSDGLIEELYRVYPNFEENEIVTVLEFEIK